MKTVEVLRLDMHLKDEVLETPDNRHLPHGSSVIRPRLLARVKKIADRCPLTVRSIGFLGSAYGGRHVGIPMYESSRRYWYMFKILPQEDNHFVAKAADWDEGHKYERCAIYFISHFLYLIEFCPGLGIK